MKTICTRPDWSDASNDYCPCDDAGYEAAFEAGENPCEDCSWYKEGEK